MFENPDDVLDVEDVIDVASGDVATLQLPTNYLSYSQLNLYGNCGERYRLKYVLDNRQPGSSNMAHGRMMHKIIEEMLLYKRDEGKLPSPEFHEDLLSDKLPEYFEDVDMWDEKIPDLVKAEEASRELLGIYYRDRLPDTRVKSVELQLKTTLQTENFTIPFVGYIDLVEHGPMDTADPTDPLYDPEKLKPTDGIRDTKITGRKYPKGKVADSLQLTLYAEALGVEDVGFDLLVQKKKSEFVPQRGTRSRADKDHALDVVDRIAGGISQGVFLKADPEHWMCSDKWCPFWSECRGKHLQVTVPKEIG